MDNKEIWKDIKGYEGQYQVSNLGRVKSLKRYIKGKNNSIKCLEEKILSFFLTHNGYKEVTLCKNSEKKLYRLNRLVAETFIPNLENKSQVNHIDGNKLNNKAENLEWCTPSENIRHAWNNGLCKSRKGKHNKTYRR